MSTSHRRPLLAAASVVCLLALNGCAIAPVGSPIPRSTPLRADQQLDTADPTPPVGRVIAPGTVIDTAGTVQLCLGAVAESAPPQCDGIPVDGWTWDGLDGSETSGDTRWGAYAVYGTYDGSRFTVTSDLPIMLALYDPIRPEDPTGGVDGTASDADLAGVQEDLSGRLGTSALSLYQERGYVWLQVAWDDGTIQRAVDADYGAGTVVVTSAMREVG
ncbi:MAG: hypothetical protein J7484_13790 [Microbacterium sp.]|nr:hypothetical protein [Microbacterium sp.]